MRYLRKRDEGQVKTLTHDTTCVWLAEAVSVSLWLTATRQDAMLFKGFINRSESKHHKLQYLVLFLRTRLEKTKCYLEPSYGKPTILSGIQKLSTDYFTITMKRVVLLPLEMNKREWDEAYKLYPGVLSIFRVETVIHFILNFIKLNANGKRSRPAVEPFMQWPAVHRPRSLELWEHLRLWEKEKDELISNETCATCKL